MNFAEYNVKDANLEEILLALKSLDTVEAVALGGSRSTGANDEIRTTIFMFTVLKFRQPKQEKISSEILFDCRIRQSLLGERGQHGYE